MGELAYNATTITARPHSTKRRLASRLPLVPLLLGGIILLAALLRFYNLSAIGDGNTYYTAAVESMLQSWHNFFFAAAEPGGSVTVDKPPLGLWIQAASAAIFGVNGVAVALPQVLAGILCVPLVYLLVKRYAGQVAGLVAALALAVTPVAIATERNNTMDATLVFTLLLATWAFVKATDSGRLRWLLAGAFLVGVGFNIKMLQAFLVLPALYALYFLGSKEGWGRKVLNLALATVLLLAVSFSWAIAVDLTPADQRPYVGSSENNTVMELIFGHNGLNRLLGGPGRGGNDGPPQANAQSDGPQAQGVLPPPAGQLPAPGQGAPGNLPAQPDGQPQGPNAGGGGPGGGDEIGEPGLLRLFTAPLSNEIGWLLPFGLFSMAVVAATGPLRLPLTDKHKALVLWGGWLLTAGVFFTVAEFYHAYYLIMMGAPLVALVGMGVAGLWELREKRPFWAWALLALGVVGTVAFQAYTAYQYVDSAPWLALAGLLVMVGLALLAVHLLWRERTLAVLGVAALGAALLVAPLVWSALTTLDAANINLPAAYEGQAEGRPAGGERASVNADLLAYLQANTQDTEYLMAVRSSMEGASYVIETGRPVLYMGGFNGGDPVVSAVDLQQMVETGDLRYVLWSGGGQGAPGGTATEIDTWLQGTCTPVRDAGFTLEEVAARNDGPPDGAAARDGARDDGPLGRPGVGSQQPATLYQCGVV